MTLTRTSRTRRRECVRERRHADMSVDMDTAVLSECEQTLSNHECDTVRVTPTGASRIRRRGCVTGGRGTDVGSCADTLLLSEYEQPLSKHERDAGRRDGNMNVVDTTARVRWEWRLAHARSCADTLPLSEYEQPLPIRERDAVRVTPTRTSRTRRRGCAGRSDMPTRGYAWTWRRYHNTNTHHNSVNMTAGA